MRLLPSYLRRDSLENPSSDLLAALTAEIDGITGIAGITLTPKSAMRLTAVSACVRLISESVGSLPLPIYRRDGRSRVKTPDDPRWELLNDSPNPEMYAMELHETVLAYANLWGKGYQYIVRNQAGMPMEYWPLHPGRTERKRSPVSQELYYTTILDSGETVPLQREEVIEIRALFGDSPIRTAKTAVTSAAAAETFGANFWSNNARPGGVIEFEKSMEETEYQEFRKRWLAGHQGLSRAQLIGILTGGAKWREVGIAPGLAQFIESRQFGVREIARLFRIPPHMLADMEGTTNRSTIEQQAIEFVVYSLRPWIVRSEQAIKMRSFNLPRDREQRVYPEWQVDGLLRGDQKSRYEAYAKGIQFGWLNRAEVRELDDRSYVDGLDEFLVPVNMMSSNSPDLHRDSSKKQGRGAQSNPAAVTSEDIRALAHLTMILRNRPQGEQVHAMLTAELERR